MPEVDVEAYRSQVFGNGTQSSTHAPTPPPSTETPATPKPTVENIVEPSTVKPDTPPAVVAAPIPDTTALVDENLIVKEKLGYDTWDAAKAEIDALKLKASTPAEIKFANDQSKLAYEALLEGKMDVVYEILDTQKKIAEVATMKSADAIKLHIAQTNKGYKQIDVEDVFEEKYSYPEKPIKGELEDDADFEAKEEKWKAAKEKIDRRIERDAATAKTELTKLSAELKLPEISKPATSANVPDEQQILADQKADAAVKEAYSKISPKDMVMVFKFNDEASKLAFDIAYEPDKESFESAVSIASDFNNKFWESYYDKDGNPDRIKFLQDLHAGRNIQKIVSEAIVQAVNQERIRALKFQKNIGDGTQRNYTVQQPTEVDKLRQQVFSK
jgi:hypothetical protein